MKRAVPLVLGLAAVAALALAAPAGAAEIIGRNATAIRLAADDHGRAFVSFRSDGRQWHIFVSGAINARAPSAARPQVKFTIDYSGGRGEWKHFRNTCGHYDGPQLAWFIAACKASDGSYWALQSWQRMLPNVGYLPWLPMQKVWELRVSHWTGPLAQLEVYQDWVYGNRYNEIFGRATYAGQAIHGFGTTVGGVPTDTYGRLIYLDTLDSAYGPGWWRENSFVVHNPSGMFCYGFYPYAAYPGYPKQRTRQLMGTGERYRLTLSGPGVTPDVAWVGAGLGAYDAQNADAVSLEQEMTAKVRAMASDYGDGLCGRH